MLQYNTTTIIITANRCVVYVNTIHQSTLMFYCSSRLIVLTYTTPFACYYYSCCVVLQHFSSDRQNVIIVVLPLAVSPWRERERERERERDKKSPPTRSDQSQNLIILCISRLDTQIPYSQASPFPRCLAYASLHPSLPYQPPTLVLRCSFTDRNGDVVR